MAQAAVAAGAPVQPGQLDRQLERQQIVLVELQPGQLLDPASRWRSVFGWMNSARALLDHAAALGQVALERVEQRGAPPVVVGDQPVDGGAHPVVRRVLGRMWTR